MRRETKQTLIIWLKRLLGFISISLWIYILYNISQSSAPFREQAPYCMVGTMTIFGLLSMSFKGLEYWEKKA